MAVTAIDRAVRVLRPGPLERTDPLGHAWIAFAQVVVLLSLACVVDRPVGFLCLPAGWAAIADRDRRRGRLDGSREPV
jgi:hypothetical protein